MSIINNIYSFINHFIMQGMQKQVIKNTMYPESPDLIKYINVPHWQFAKIVDIFEETYIDTFFNVYMFQSDAAAKAHKAALDAVAARNKAGDTKNGKPILSPDIVLLGDGLPGTPTFSMALTIDNVSYVFMYAKEYGYYFSYASDSDLAAKFEAILNE
jgi:hypothetical protein